MNVVSPLKAPLNPTQLTLFEPAVPLDPFPRRASIALIKGLSSIKEASGHISPREFVEELPDGVSANLCESLFKMKPSGEASRLEVRVKWSGALGRKPTELPVSVSFAQPNFEFIKSVGVYLRSQAEEIPETVIGSIVDLHSDVSPRHGHRGQITIKRSNRLPGTMVKAILGTSDYSLACDAHRDAKEIEITGIVHKDPSMKIPQVIEYISFRLRDR